MGKSTVTLCLLAAFAGALAACSSSDKGTVDNPNIFPSDFRKEVLSTLRKVLDDPTKVRDAYLSDPALTPVGKDQRYTICLRYNARNSLHQYMGSTVRIGYFYEGHINQLVEATKEQCGNAAYKPFPELESICLAKKCE
jgi:hypothetical protein